MAGHVWGLNVLLLAGAFAMAAYFGFWWMASGQTVEFSAGPETMAQARLLPKFYFLNWVSNPFTAALQHSEFTWLSKRSVTFRGPGQNSGAYGAGYHLIAKDETERTMLLQTLHGRDLIEEITK